MIRTDVLKEHAHQVLHVSFSHNGKMFATCSKDGYVIVSSMSRDQSPYLAITHFSVFTTVRCVWDAIRARVCMSPLPSSLSCVYLRL